ncbi:MAG: hypothetical protein SFU56_07250 [Capsulimonadales bacterium]|nr:hypothetical protein [Capsulimonadales bacterium]
MKRIIWWIVFATAFGMTEAALVVNVRHLLGWEDGLDYAQLFAARGMSLDSGAFTRLFRERQLLPLEIAREAATILLLVGAAMAAGTSWRERWGIFWLTFAVWDLTYYLFLKVFIDFPRSLNAIDVYFLIPITWYGPVWFPVCVVMPALTLLGLRLLWVNPGGRLDQRPLNDRQTFEGNR